MNRTTVLLVDDQPAFGHHLTAVFGNALIWDRDAASAAARLEGGYRPDVAFVDFHLGNGAATGLTVMRALVDHSRATKRICYTTLGEGGRILYAVGARRWFGAHAILDKGFADDTVLRAAARGTNPTPAAWEENLLHADLIDGLFKKPSWLTLWRVWPQAHGSRRAAKALASAASEPNDPLVTDTMVREFAEDAQTAMDSFRARFGPATVTTTRGNVARGAPLAAFSAANRTFFNADDLDDTLTWVARRRGL